MNIFQRLFRMLIGEDAENQRAISIILSTLNALLSERNILEKKLKKKNITEREKWRWKFVSRLYDQKIYDYSWVLELLGYKIKIKKGKNPLRQFDDYGLAFSAFVEEWRPYFKKQCQKN